MDRGGHLLVGASVHSVSCTIIGLLTLTFNAFIEELAVQDHTTYPVACRSDFTPSRFLFFVP